MENGRKFSHIVKGAPVDGLTLMHIWAALIRLGELLITKIFKGKHETEREMKWMH